MRLIKKALWFIPSVHGCVAWLLPVLSWVLGGGKPGFDRKNLILMGVWPQWFSNIYRYSVGIGNAIVLRPEHINKDYMLKHERIHVFQFREHALAGFFWGLMLAFAGEPASGVTSWLSSLTWPIFGFIAAWLRGKRFYLDAEDERSARAQTLTKAVLWLRSSDVLD